MESTEDIEWKGNSLNYFIERIASLEKQGEYEGHFGLGVRLTKGSYL